MSSIVGLINIARSNPDRAAADLSAVLKKSYKGTVLHCFNKNIDTFQGIKCIEDMQESLRTMQPVKSLIEMPYLCRAAEIIAKQKGRVGDTSHQNPKRINEIISKFCGVNGKVGELMCFNTDSPQEVYTYFMMDDGLVSRKRRRMLLSSQYRYIGVGSAPHTLHGNITIILLAQDIQH